MSEDAKSWKNKFLSFGTPKKQENQSQESGESWSGKLFGTPDPSTQAKNPQANPKPNAIKGTPKVVDQAGYERRLHELEQEKQLWKTQVDTMTLQISEWADKEQKQQKLLLVEKERNSKLEKEVEEVQKLLAQEKETVGLNKGNYSDAISKLHNDVETTKSLLQEVEFEYEEFKKSHAKDVQLIKNDFEKEKQENIAKSKQLKEFETKVFDLNKQIEIFAQKSTAALEKNLQTKVTQLNAAHQHEIDKLSARIETLTNSRNKFRLRAISYRNKMNDKLSRDKEIHDLQVENRRLKEELERKSKTVMNLLQMHNSLTPA